jgi:hypothetical protein
MKIRMILFSVFLIILNSNCNSQKCLDNRTKKVIENSYKNADTVYQYSVAFNNLNLIWYHKGDFIYSFWVKPHKTKKNKPIKANNIAINNDSISKYFDNFLFKDIRCFESKLDGASIELCIKGNKCVMSCIDLQCLFNTKYKQNSFPYKLQYDFSKILKSKDYDFNKLYQEIQ